MNAPDPDVGQSGPAAQQASDPEVLRKDIDETREALGDTVEALSAKADVKAQAQQKVEETKAQAQQKVEEGKEKLRETQQQAGAKLSEAGSKAREKPAPVAGAAGALVFLLLVLWLIRRR